MIIDGTECWLLTGAPSARGRQELDHALEVLRVKLGSPAIPTRPRPCGLVGVRDDLVGQRVALANQLRCLLEQFWPWSGGDLRRRRLADRARVPRPLSDPQSRARLARSAWPRSWRGTRTAVVVPSPSCSSVSVPPRAGPPASSRPSAYGRSSLPSSTPPTHTPTVNRHVAVPQGTRLCRDLLAEIGDDRARFVSGDPRCRGRRRACDPRARGVRSDPASRASSPFASSTGRPRE